MDSPKAKILVTDACRGAAVASIRSLARSGYEVIAADAVARSPGLASRYAKHRVIYACPKLDPQQFTNDLLNAVERYQIDLILPITEQAGLPLEAERERVEKVCRVPWAPVEAVATVRDKRLTFQLAEKLSVPYPRTCLVHSAEEAIRAAPDFGWPIVLKPNSSHTLAGEDAVQVWSVEYARNEDELREKMTLFEGRCAVLLQEYFQGAGIGVEVLAHNGDPICAFQHRRLREVPLTGGASSLRQSETLDPVLYKYTLDLLKALNWTGLAMVEFKQNDRGEARLMEINGRIWGSLPVAVAAGVDFPVALCKLTLDGAPTGKASVKLPEYRPGVRVQNFQKEISWILRVLRGSSTHPVMKLPKRRAAIGAMIDLLRPSYQFDILSLRDPMPAARIVSNLFRTGLQSVTRRFGRRAVRKPADRAGEGQERELVEMSPSMAPPAK